MSYGIDNASLTVWVDNRAILEREHAGRLCRRHADALVVPRGWTVDDRRQAIPQLFRVPDADATVRDKPRTAPAPRPARRARAEGGPSLFESIEAELREREMAADAPSADEVATFHGVAAADETVEGQETDVDANGAEEDDGDVPAPTEFDPDETKAIPWSPRLVSSGDEPEGEDAPVYGRLLGRAFGKKNPQ